MTDLAARLWADTAGLLRAEMALAGVEARDALRSVLAGLAGFGVALGLAIAALVALTGAAAHALIAAGLPPALAYLAVALVALLAGWLCVAWAVSALKRAAGMPARTVRNLRRDVETLATMVNRNA